MIAESDFLHELRPDYASKLNRGRFMIGMAGGVGLIEWKLDVSGGAMTYRSIFLALTLMKLWMLLGAALIPKSSCSALAIRW